MSKTASVRVGEDEYSISRDEILAVAEREAPRRVNAYFVEIDGRRYPPKQLVRSATGTTRPFVTAVAVRALRALGFEVVAMPGTS
jgi:hypothetical protein